MKKLSALFSVALWIAAPMTARATDYYVSTGGIDSAAGTLAAPWRTMQKAANTVVAGDVVSIRGGIYSERISLSGKHGALALPVVFQSYTGETAVVDQSGVTPPNGTTALLTITNCDYITVSGIEFRNYKTAGTNAQQKAQLPVGIYITGAGSGIKLLGCKVHDIWQSCATLNDFGANGFGIAVYGTSATAIDGLVLDGNEVYNLRTGASESVVLNGNVTNFLVTNNLVHDNNNIGIDFIGFEGANANPALDQARNGLCSRNTVYNIDSALNPAYGGSFTANPPNDDARGAPGLYVDGGSGITIERNLAYQCNFGVSVSSEHSGKLASSVIVRNNVLHHNHVGGIVIGGATMGNGGTQNCSFTNNTLYLNDTSGYGGGQFSVQHNVSGCVIRNNIMVCNATTQQFVLSTGSNVSFAAQAINWNLYSGAPSNSVEFIWNGVSRGSFASWKTASGQDANSFFAASPGFTNASANDFALLVTSAAVNAGDNALVPANGETDYGGQSRLAGGRVDIGADEYLTAWQAWRDEYFALPDGGADANAMDDPDKEGIVNVMEYALNANPTLADTSVLPRAGTNGTRLTLSFTRNLNATDLTYAVEASNDLASWPVIASKTGAAAWSTASGASVTDPGTGSVTITDSVAISPGVRRFLRLRVTQ